MFIVAFCMFVWVFYQVHGRSYRKNAAPPTCVPYSITGGEKEKKERKKKKENKKETRKRKRNQKKKRKKRKKKRK